jgi:hypothetical protein
LSQYSLRATLSGAITTAFPQKTFALLLAFNDMPPNFQVAAYRAVLSDML